MTQHPGGRPSKSTKGKTVKSAKSKKTMTKQEQKAMFARQASQTIQRRTVAFLLAFGVVCFAAVVWKLYDLQIKQHDDLKARAVRQQTASITVTASRGTIYDRNGATLASSATAETVFISPKEISKYAEGKDMDDRDVSKQDRNKVAQGLARILEMDVETILKRMENTYSQFEVLRKDLDRETADELRRFINGAIDEYGAAVLEDDQVRLHGIYLADGTKRFYPYSSLAAHVVGFVGAENYGLYGTEALYDEALQGSDGLMVSAKNANGTEVLYQYEQYYDPENGQDLHMTLDTTIQYYLERGLEEMVARYDAKNGATGIVMDPNTGAILAMASNPSYDLNDFAAIYDPVLQQQIPAEGTEGRAEIMKGLRDKQWRNKTVTDTYEPGSTYKILTLSIGLEEGKIDKSTTFTCNGSVTINNHSIGCSRKTGHGLQNLTEAAGNSCNPAFINIGLRIGQQTYYEYLEKFGLFSKTGVDLQGEVKGSFADAKTFASADIYLACYAFGQTFTVTPLQLITAQAACINGGYLHTPYVVEKITDSQGNVISQHDSTPVRQVISEETSATVREILEYVVASPKGSGRNGKVAGYRIGGKTGTADKTGSATEENPRGDLVVSFVCFAPVDDPQVIMLLTLDTPSRTTGTYPSGGQMVAPIASSIMTDILPYLGIDPQYTDQEMTTVDATVPYLVGLTTEEAKARMKEYGFTNYRTVGEGETITDQTPLGGAIVPANAELLLYRGQEKPGGLCTVPNVVGLTAAKANEAITGAGLIMRVTGTAAQGSSVVAVRQSDPEGTQVAPGTVISVQFGDTSVLD